MRRWLIALNVLVLVAASVRLINIYLPYRPTREAAIEAVRALEGITMTLTFPGSPIIQYDDVTIVETIDRVPRAVLVIYNHHQLTDGVATVQCSSLDYMTHHLLNGVASHSGPGICHFLPLNRAEPISLLDNQESGTYILLGVALDERIARVRGVWSDGHVESATIQEGAFFFFRERDDVRIEWVVGVDAEGQELPETRTDNH